MISLWLKLVVYYLKEIWSYNALKVSPTSPTKASFNGIVFQKTRLQKSNDTTRVVASTQLDPM